MTLNMISHVISRAYLKVRVYDLISALICTSFISLQSAFCFLTFGGLLKTLLMLIPSLCREYKTFQVEDFFSKLKRYYIKLIFNI